MYNYIGQWSGETVNIDANLFCYNCFVKVYVYVLGWIWKYLYEFWCGGILLTPDVAQY